MKNKIKTSLFVFIVIGVVVLNITYKNKNEVTKNKQRKQNNLAIMVKEDGASDYTKSTSKDIPIGNYVLNEEKTHCENNGKILNYDNTTGKVSFSFIGSDRCYLYFDYYKEPVGYEIIIANNGGKGAIEAKGTPDFSKVATENEGMYAADDDLGTSYYFRGAVNNNWVKFGKDSGGNDIYWRIIRINGNGSIRMIYSGTTTPDSTTAIVMTGDGTQIGLSQFNSNYNNPSYAGYMYTIGQQHGTSTSSAIKTIIDDWYTSTTLETDTSTKALVSQDQIYCNDRSVTSGSYSTTGSFGYAAVTRLSTNPSPILTCSTESDKFTSKNSSIGNKVLDYPVGLIAVDEVAMAGNIYGASMYNSSYYLYTNKNYWTGTPANYDRAQVMLFLVNSSGDIYHYYPETYYGVRPVISLSSSVKLSGDGTWNNVYTVS